MSFWLRAARASDERHDAALRYAIGIAVIQVFWIARLFVLESYGIWTFLVLAAAEMAIPAIAEPRASETAWHPEHIAELSSLIDAGMSDATSSWWLGSDGQWTRHDRDEKGAPLADLQSDLMTQIGSRRRSGR